MSQFINTHLAPWSQLDTTTLAPLQPGQALTQATNDEQALYAYFLARKMKPSSQSNVERDYRKLKLFMAENKITHFKQISVEFCAAFQQWLANPPAHLILAAGKKKAAFYLSDQQINPQWRPFSAALSSMAISRCVSNLQALFSWLVTVDYLQRNPWLVIKTIKVIQQSNLNQRHFPLSVIQLVNQYLQQANTENKRQQQRLIQQRWLFKLYLLTGSRVSACTFAKTKDIQNIHGCRYIKLIVKGSGERSWYLPWIDALEQERQRYLTALKIQDHDEQFLIAPSIGQQSQAVSRNLVWRSIKQLFQGVITHFATEHLSASDQYILQHASPHWIRHGSATLLGSSAKDILGHQTEQQTLHYQHTTYQTQVTQLEQLLSNSE